jgi:hypothetical protein
MDGATARNSPTLQFLIVITIIVMVGTFYILTIREGHDWGDDFSMYIRHAMNIVEGKAYADTGYILNPYYPFLGPQAYPPVFPILLSPVYYWFGLNLQAMKVEIILFFSVFLFIFWLTIKDELPFPHQVAVITILGINPYFWEFKDQVISEIPFLLFTFVGLLFIQRAKKPHPSQKVSILYAVATGFIIYVAYGIRSAGGILLPCLLLYDLLVSKRLTSFAIIATAVAVPMIALQNVLLPAATSIYVSLFTFKLENIYSNSIQYSLSMSTIMDNGYSRAIQLVFFAILCGFALIGYLISFRKNVTIYALFMPMYMGMVLIFSGFGGARYLIPIMPLFVLYIFMGVNTKYPRGAERIILAILILGIFGSYAGKYTTENYGPITNGINKQEARDLFAYIRANTEEDAILIFRKPRALALFTGRRALVFQFHESEESTISYFREVGADYLVDGLTAPGYLREFIKDREECFKLVYSNSDFRVYKIRYDNF